MKRVLTLFAVFLFLISPVFAKKSLVKLENLSFEKVREIAKRDLDFARVEKNFIEVVLDEEQLKGFSNEKISCSYIIFDLDNYISKIIRSQTKDAQYFTYKSMTDALKGYAEKYSGVCKLESIGKSCEDRDIWGLKISDNPEKDEKEPAALIMGAHHSREWISFEVPMATIKTLLEGYGNDEKITGLINEREIWIVPMVNPDGVIYSQTNEKYWRKNRRKNQGGSYGVDPNRNYGFKWGVSGSSSSPGSDVYHGPGPFSEPETQAIRDLAQREHFQADISFHSYSELILYPWSYAENVPNPHHDLFAKFGEEMSKFNGYTSEVSSDLYPSSGDTDDYLYGELKSLSFTFELATTFIPQPSMISQINKQNVPAVLYLIEKAGTYGLVSPAGGDAIPALNSATLISALNDFSPFSLDEGVQSRIQQVQRELAHR
ncbi:zinc carboxypeptidase, partial [bacterium]|nr:zinc carboxypeptidase [bacterium]